MMDTQILMVIKGEEGKKEINIEDTVGSGEEQEEKDKEYVKYNK